jgi:hypothetical protein
MSTEWTPVTSSVIALVRYDADAETLDIAFQSGKVYRYFGVPAHTYGQLMAAESKGQFFNAHIRDRFSYAPVER